MVIYMVICVLYGYICVIYGYMNVYLCMVVFVFYICVIYMKNRSFQRSLGVKVDQVIGNY